MSDGSEKPLLVRVSLRSLRGGGMESLSHQECGRWLGRDAKQFANEERLAHRVAFGQPSHSSFPNYV